MWSDRRLLDLLDIEHPIIQAPMAGAMDFTLAAEVSAAGGLGSLPCAMIGPDTVREEVGRIRARTNRPFNLNFFCHTPPTPDPAREAAWKQHLAGYYRELGLDVSAPTPGASRAPFDEAMCQLVEALGPKVASFHFGLPSDGQIDRLKQRGVVILASATTAAEARALESRGVDAVIAQGYEAGGHRGIFLDADPVAALSRQSGTFALVPQIVDAVKVPVIAAGGVADGRGMAAALMLGAAGVQIGTAYLACPESRISRMHRAALAAASDDSTAVTNIMSGRPARGIVNRAIREVGPISPLAPAFPLASGALAPLRAKAEADGSGDFSPLWAGQAAGLARELAAAELTRRLAEDALALLGRR